MAVMAVGPEDYLYDAQYNDLASKKEALLSLSCKDLHESFSEKTLSVLLLLSESIRTHDSRRKSTTRNMMRFAVPPQVKEVFHIPDEVAGVSVVVNRAIPVTTKTEFFTNRPRWGGDDFPESEVFEKWTERSVTSVYLVDCENFDTYELYDVFLPEK